MSNYFEFSSTKRCSKCNSKYKYQPLLTIQAYQGYANYCKKCIEDLVARFDKFIETRPDFLVKEVEKTTNKELVKLTFKELRKEFKKSVKKFKLIEHGFNYSYDHSINCAYFRDYGNLTQALVGIENSETINAGKAIIRVFYYTKLKNSFDAWISKDTYFNTFDAAVETAVNLTQQEITEMYK